MQYTTEQIYKMLLSESFSQWYMNDFEEHVTAESGCKIREDIIKDLNDFLS